MVVASGRVGRHSLNVWEGEVCFIAQTAPNSNAYNNLCVLSYRSGSQNSGEVLMELKLKVWVGCVHATTSNILRLLEAACISGL